MVEQFKVQSSVQIRNTRRAREAKVAEETWNATIKADIGRGDEDAAMRDIAEAKGLNALSESQAEHLVKEVPGLIDEQDIKQMLNREDITLTAMLEAKDKNGVEKYFKRLTPEKRSYYEGKARDMKFSVQARNAAKYNQMMAGGNYPDDDELEAAVKSQEIDQGMADSIAARRDGLIAKKNEARTKTQIYVDAMNTMASVPDGGRLTAEDRNGIEKAAIMADGNEGSLISKELEYRFGKTGSDGAPGGAGAVNRVMNYITADYNRELAIEESKIKNPFLVGLDIGAGNTLLARLPKNIPDPVLFRIRERYDGYRMAVLDFIEQENKAGRPLDLHILRKKYEEVRNLGNMGPSVTRATWGR
jgi:hypothetical protein